MACIDVTLTDTDLATAPLVKSWLSVAMDANPGGTLRIDLAEVDVLEDGELAVLMSALLGMRHTGGSVVLLHVRPAMAAALELTRLDRVFRFED
jgi:anti-anti-sigma factor